MNLLLILFLFLNAAHLILTVNEPKVETIRPTFDEIYGKGWDKDGHEKIKVETSPLNSGENALNEQADHDDNIDQDVEAYNSDSTDQNLTQQDPESINQSDHEIVDGINKENEFSEQQKREIICKFHALKEEYKKKGKVTKKEKAKIERKIGKDLRVNRANIYKWKKELGMADKKSYSDQQKYKIISKFNSMKEEYKQKRIFPTAERVKIEEKIGNKLGVNRKKIYKWKKEFGFNKKHFYKKKKLKFIERIEEIKMCQPGEQIKLIKDLGISEGAFNSWKKEFGLPINSNVIYSDSEKMELMGKYYEIKQRNPKLNVTDIAKRLNVARANLYKWKKQFDSILNKNSVDEEHSLAENRLTLSNNDTSEHSMPSSNDNFWAWNLAKKKRTERIEVENSP